MDIYHQSILFLKNSSQVVRFLITFILLLLLVGVWYILLYKPLSAALAFYTAQNQILQTKKIKLSRVAKTVEQLNQEIEELERVVGNVTKSLDCDVHVALEKVLACAKKHSLYVPSCKIGKTETQNSLFSIATCECSLLGAYENSVQALQNIENLYPAVSCVGIELRKAVEGCTWLLKMRIFLRPMT